MDRDDDIFNKDMCTRVVKNFGNGCFKISQNLRFCSKICSLIFRLIYFEIIFIKNGCPNQNRAGFEYLNGLEMIRWSHVRVLTGLTPEPRYRAGCLGPVWAGQGHWLQRDGPVH